MTGTEICLAICIALKSKTEFVTGKPSSDTPTQPFLIFDLIDASSRLLEDLVIAPIGNMFNIDILFASFNM